MEKERKKRRLTRYKQLVRGGGCARAYDHIAQGHGKPGPDFSPHWRRKGNITYFVDSFEDIDSRILTFYPHFHQSQGDFTIFFHSTNVPPFFMSSYSSSSSFCPLSEIKERLSKWTRGTLNVLSHFYIFFQMIYWLMHVSGSIRLLSICRRYILVQSLCRQ